MAQRNGFQILLLFCLIQTSVMGQATITTPPENVAQYVGDNVELVCEFQQSDLELVWSECITSPACKPLFRDGVAIPGASPPSRYSVVDRNVTSGERYDFVITGVQTADGGKFRCDSTTTPAPAYAEVIVLGSDMQCSNNLTSGSEVELGDFTYLSSDVTFHGRWPPVARFRYPDNTALTGGVNETSGVTAKYSVVLEAVKSLQGQTLSAEWYFNVTGTAASEATNTPDFPAPNTCSSQPITVFYRPNVTISDTITCTAEGNPTPDRRWINLNDTGETVDCVAGDPCQLDVTDRLIGLTYRCEACNTYWTTEPRCDHQDVTLSGVSLSPSHVIAVTMLIVAKQALDVYPF